MSQYRILVTGGAGYIGSVLCPKLLRAGHDVTVFDGLFFGRKPIDALLDNSNFKLIKGDIRDHHALLQVYADGKFDRVIHLAAVSNDPCSELDADITRSVNLDGTRQVIEVAKAAGVERVLYASSASVYGLRQETDVTEDLKLQPLTLYARYKGEGEEILNKQIDDAFEGVSVRSATVCGMSPRLRLDLTVNILTYHAICNGKMTVFGGAQMRPNVHVEDLANFYIRLLDAPNVSGEAFNVSYSNETVRGIAEIVRSEIGLDIPIETTPSDDNRSYHLDSSKAARWLDFKPTRSIADAVRDLKRAFEAGEIEDPTASWYRNVALMTEDMSFWRNFT